MHSQDLDAFEVNGAASPNFALMLLEYVPR
jgi:hypothetical protein